MESLKYKVKRVENDFVNIDQLKDRDIGIIETSERDSMNLIFA